MKPRRLSEHSPSSPLYLSLKKKKNQNEIKNLDAPADVSPVEYLKSSPTAGPWSSPMAAGGERGTKEEKKKRVQKKKGNSVFVDFFIQRKEKGNVTRALRDL